MQVWHNGTANSTIPLLHHSARSQYIQRVILLQVLHLVHIFSLLLHHKHFLRMSWPLSHGCFLISGSWNPCTLWWSRTSKYSTKCFKRNWFRIVWETKLIYKNLLKMLKRKQVVLAINLSTLLVENVTIHNNNVHHIYENKSFASIFVCEA